MDGRLMKIANMLTLHLDTIEDMGLLGGKMGAALFYYELSGYTGIATYDHIADGLLDEVLNGWEHIKSDGIEAGVPGIGWGINYLIRHSLIEASEDILEDLEAHLFYQECLNLDAHFSALSPAVYLLSKPGCRYQIGQYEKWVSELLNACRYYCLNVYDNKKKPLDLINSMLYFLLELKKMDVHTWEASKLVWKLLKYLSNCEDLAEDQSGDSLILLRLLGQMDDTVAEKGAVLDKLSGIEAQSWSVKAYKKIIWQYLLFFQDNTQVAKLDVDKLWLSIAADEVGAKDILIPLGLYLMNQYKTE